MRAGGELHASGGVGESRRRWKQAEGPADERGIRRDLGAVDEDRRVSAGIEQEGSHTPVGQELELIHASRRNVERSGPRQSRSGGQRSTTEEVDLRIDLRPSR